MANSQEVFEREKELCELFQCNDRNKNLDIDFNVSSKGFVIWVHYGNDDHWDCKRGELILSCLIKQFKLHKIGYKEKPNVLRYNSAFWLDHKLTVEYFAPCPKLHFDVFNSDPEYLEYSTEHNF